jgi:hypothetical protein
MSTIRVRELHRLPLGRHWVVVSGGIPVADMYGKREGVTVIVRAHSCAKLSGALVVTSPDLDSAVADFTVRWSA